MEAHMNPPQSNDMDFYDVVIMGGALSGGATATLLLRQNPGIRILILEKSTRLSRRQANLGRFIKYVCRRINLIVLRLMKKCSVAPVLLARRFCVPQRLLTCSCDPGKNKP